jgi:Fe2+ transport system protein B
MFYKYGFIVVVAVQLTACAFINSQTVDGNADNSRNMNQSTQKNAEVSTDIDALAKAMNLPVRPTEAKWQAKALGNTENRAPGPTDYSLTAVLKYNDAEAQELIKKLESVPVEKKTANIEVEGWFPEEVKKNQKTVDGINRLKGANYSPDAFLRSPYSGGRVVRVGETNYFIVKLLTF